MEAPPLAASLERARAGAEAVRGEHLSLTYGELLSGARTMAARLGSPGSPVGIALPSGPRLVEAFVAAAIAGRPACVLHSDFAAAERHGALAAAGVTELLSSGGVAELPAPARPYSGPATAFYVGFTSGTSGTPKPFVRSWPSWQQSFGPAAELYRLRSGSTVILPGALQHSHFLFGAVIGLARGAAVRLWERFDAASVRGALATSGRSVLFVVPTMLVALGDAGRSFPEVETVVVSGSAYDARHRAIARRLFPAARIVQIYGASELSFVTVAVDDPGSAAGDDVGVPFPGVELELRSAEIWVRSPYLFDGYLGDGGLDDLRDERGFATVGDLGELDGSGRLTLRGRASNMLITGGKNVHPEEIESVLRDHEAVSECAVLGVPDDYWGERLVAVVEERSGCRATDAELDAHVRSRLAAYKAPKEWHRVASLPRTATGKVARARAMELLGR